jgi:ABC-type sugar transport system ATPase subunit
MSAFENIAMPLQSGLVNRGNKKEAQKQRVIEIAQSLQIEHLLERKVSTLTVREQLNVALARGFARKPQLYLFDESFMQMDTPTRLAARREMVEFQRATQIPCIYMTRDQPEAFALANRVGIINDGEMQQVGTRAELFYAPATLWVAQWLGFPPMNTITGYLQGTYHPDGMHYRVWAKSMAPLLPMKWTTVLSSLQSPDVTVGIRPEDIIPEWEFAEKWHPSLCAVKVEVLASEWNQGKTLAQFQLPHAADQFIAVLDIPHDQLKIGQIITIAFDPARFCLFHPRTQQLLYAPPVLPGSNRRMNNLSSSQPLHGYHLDRPR